MSWWYSLARTRCVNVATMHYRRQIVVFWFVGIGVCWGCANTTEGAGLAASEFLGALQEQDAGAVHALLEPNTVEQMNVLYGTIKTLEERVEKHYSADGRKQIMASIGLVQWPKSELDLLKPWQEQASQLPPMTALQRWGATVSTVTVVDEQATVTTWGGDVIHLRHVDAGWRVVLNDDSALQMKSMGLRVNRVNTQVGSAIQGLNYAHRYGGSQ